MYNDAINVSGLPICWHNNSDWDNNFGRSILDDIIPIFNELEDLMSKMGDSIYTLSLNPIPIVIGQELQGSVSADATGFNIALENGSDMKYVNAEMDYNTIKLYLDTLQKNLNNIAHMPSIALGNTNVSNVSEVSLKLLYQLADVMAMLNEKWFREGLQKRFNMFDKLLALKGVTFKHIDYIDVEFNYSRPVNAEELLANIKTQFDMGAISVRSIIEKSPITTDVNQEMERLGKDKTNIDMINND